MQGLRASPGTAKKIEFEKNQDGGNIFGRSFIFRLRQHKNGHFGGQGLWEMALLNEKGESIEVVSDADALQYCLENMAGILEREGF